MRTAQLRDKGRIEAFLRQNPFLHIFPLGDLDEYFWPHTTWHALVDGGEIKAITLVYSGLSEPVVIAGSDDAGLPFLDELLRSIAHLLPPRFSAHVSPEVLGALEGRFRLCSHGPHSQMALLHMDRLAGIDTSDVVALTGSDADELVRFYADNYPGNYFEPSMMALGAFCGIRVSGDLISVAGVLVLSKAYRVAALGNICTRRANRERGFGRAAVAGLCRNLSGAVDHIGLAVKSDNASAIRCYEAVGFETIRSYEQCSAEAM